MSAVSDLLGYAMKHPVGRRTPVRTVSRILNWQLKSRLMRGPFVEPWIDGAKLVVEKGMTGATGNLYFGLHEFADMGFLLHFLRPADLFVDVGANVGTYTVLAARVCKAYCISFEPSPATVIDLQRNLAVNAIDKRVRVEQVALGKENGTVNFTNCFGAMNKVVAEAGVNTETVAIKRLDDVIGDATPIMMKIDVEGHEVALFSGAAHTLSLPSLQVIEIETVEGAMVEQLAEAGFAERYYDPFSRTLSSNPENIFGNNRLYIRDEDFVRERLATAPMRAISGVML